MQKIELKCFLSLLPALWHHTHSIHSFVACKILISLSLPLSLSPFFLSFSLPTRWNMKSLDSHSVAQVSPELSIWSTVYFPYGKALSDSLASVSRVFGLQVWVVMPNLKCLHFTTWIKFSCFIQKFDTRVLHFKMSLLVPNAWWIKKNSFNLIFKTWNRGRCTTEPHVHVLQ